MLLHLIGRRDLLVVAAFCHSPLEFARKVRDSDVRRDLVGLLHALGLGGDPRASPMHFLALAWLVGQQREEVLTRHLDPQGFCAANRVLARPIVLPVDPKTGAPELRVTLVIRDRWNG